MPLKMSVAVPQPEVVYRNFSKNVSPVGRNSTDASLAPRHLRQGYGFGANRRGIIAHWDVPRPFPEPHKALMELGLERYKDAVREYYSNICDVGVENAHYAHARWVVRHCLSNFETEMRRFRRHWEYRGPERNLAENRGLLITPEEMYMSHRMMVDIRDVLKRWQVREDLRPATERLLRAQLTRLWELRP